MPRKPKIRTPEGEFDPGQDSHSKLVDIKAVTSEDVKRILAENERLTRELAESQEKRTEAEQKLVDQATAQLGQTDIREVPTKKFVNLRVLDVSYDADVVNGAPRGYKIVGYKDDAGGRPILKPVFKTERVPTFFYKIDLAPNGGDFLSINGIHYYHGTIVELDLHTLRCVKDMVFRGWDHERSISGHNENAYRKERRDSVSSKGFM